MTAQFTPRDDVVWKDVSILKVSDLGPLPHEYEYQFKLPVPLADWDVFDYWERARFHSMRDNLSPGDVLFDVGTEQGWCNLLYASFVGPENMVLIEPTAEFWPNIHATWCQNFGEARPRAAFCGLLSDRTTEPPRTSSPDSPAFAPWPVQVAGPLIDRNRYQYIHDNTENVPELRLDDFVERSGITPAAITMDVEGAELLVLRGAEHTLRTHHPLVWVSIHPDLGERDYGIIPKHVHRFMAECGYSGEHLATDHEEHWYFS